MKREVLLLFLIFLSNAVFSAADSLTLRQAVERADSYPAIQQTAHMEDAAQYGLTLAKHEFWPTVAIQSSFRTLEKDPGFIIPANSLNNPAPIGMVIGDRNVAQYAILAEQLIWDFGKSSNAIRSREAMVESAKWKTSAVRMEIQRQIVHAYLNIQLTDHLGAVAQATKADITESARVADELYQQGLVTRADRLAVISAKEQAEVTLLQAERARATARKLLSILIGEEVCDVTPVDAVPEDETDTTLWETKAYATRPDIMVLRSWRKSLELDVREIQAVRYPKLSAVAGYTSIDDEYQLHKANTSFQLNFTIPLFDGGRSSPAASAKRSEVASVEAQIELLKRQISLEITNLLETFKESRQTVVWAGKSVEHAREVVNLMQYRYQQGLVSQWEVLDAVSDRERAETLLANAQVALLSARSDLYQASGADQEDFLKELGL